MTDYNDCPNCGASSPDYERPFTCGACGKFFPELRLPE